MWGKPWKYREGFIFGVMLVAAGLVLQLTVGPLDWTVFRAPVNYVALALLCVFIAVLYVVGKSSCAVRFLISRHAAVPCLVFATLLTAVMGLTRQVPAPQPPADALGISRMLSFWPFVLTYLWMTLIVGLVSVKYIVPARENHFRRERLKALAPFLCHMGLFVILTSATLGSADMQRVKMICTVGEPERRVVNAEGMLQQLNVAIELKRFVLETYDTDSTESGMAMMMPRRFASEIVVHSNDGKTWPAVVEVNRPADVMGWKIYQYGYDTAAGAESRISILELVRDPWLPAVYAGIFMLLAGAVLMMFRKKRSYTP